MFTNLDSVLNAPCYLGADSALESYRAMEHIFDCTGRTTEVTDRSSRTTNANRAHAVGFPPTEVIRKALIERGFPNSDHFG